MKLYELRTKGLGDYWVVAENPHEADKILTSRFQEADYGFFSDRLVVNTRLITEMIGEKPFIVW